MTDINMDSAFDRSAIITDLTINNVCSIPFLEMLEILTPLVVTEIPEGDTVNEKKRLDFLLARTANMYAYLRVLWARVSYERAIRRAAKDDYAEMLTKKKEALYELGNAMKLKYEAASRKVTVALEEDDTLSEKVSYDSRREARDNRNEKNGWKAETVGPPKADQPKRGAGGWSALG